MRVNVVIRYIGMVMQFIATFMLASAGVSLLNDYDSGFSPLLLSAFLTALLGLFPLLFVDRVEEIKTKEGYAIVVGSWHQHLFAAQLRRGGPGLEAQLVELELFFFCQNVQRQKAHVVPGVFIFGAGVA